MAHLVAVRFEKTPLSDGIRQRAVILAQKGVNVEEEFRKLWSDACTEVNGGPTWDEYENEREDLFYSVQEKLEAIFVTEGKMSSRMFSALVTIAKKTTVLNANWRVCTKAPVKSGALAEIRAEAEAMPPEIPADQRVEQAIKNFNLRKKEKQNGPSSIPIGPPPTILKVPGAKDSAPDYVSAIAKTIMHHLNKPPVKALMDASGDEASYLKSLYDLTKGFLARHKVAANKPEEVKAAQA